VLPNGHIISGSWDKTLREWDQTTGQCLKSLEAPSFIGCITALPNGNIIHGCTDNTLKEWGSPYLRFSLLEMKKNSSVLAQAWRTKTSFFSLLPDEIKIKVIAHTGNESIHNEEDRNKLAEAFSQEAQNEHQESTIPIYYFL
jgi:WD40 repeat protein